MTTNSGIEGARVVEDLLRALRQFDVCVVVGRGHGGRMPARPVRIVEVDAERGILLLLTSSTSPLVEELRTPTEVTATMQTSSRYLCVHGKASVVSFAAGPSERGGERPLCLDPEAGGTPVLVEMVASQADYWDVSTTSGARVTFDAGAADRASNG